MAFSAALTATLGLGVLQIIAVPIASGFGGLLISYLLNKRTQKLALSHIVQNTIHELASKIESEAENIHIPTDITVDQ
jgi:hypothetical protein